MRSEEAAEYATTGEWCPIRCLLCGDVFLIPMAAGQRSVDEISSDHLVLCSGRL